MKSFFTEKELYKPKPTKIINGFECNKIYNEDCLETMARMEDNSVDMVITSPPYWALRDYGVEGQIGLEPTYQKYIENLIIIFNEIHRVLKKEGTCWVNIGDTYGGSGKGAGGYSDKSTLQGYSGEGTKGRKMAKENWNFAKAPKENGVSKCLCQIPSRFAIEMTNRGWILRNEIIWYKPNAMPSSVKDRFTVDFEKLFFFTKSKKYYFKQQLEPLSKVSIKDMESRNKFNNKGSNNIYACGGEGRSRKEFYNPEGRNKRCVWEINTKPISEKHYAIYPKELIKTPIKAGCPENGVVFDPFMGSGTTAIVSNELKRNWVGSELSKEYIKIANKRINNVLTWK